ncbi:MAG TPA: winged helix-turn-helix domain-containing protein, partial [Polyangiaceae bacterium]
VLRRVTTHEQRVADRGVPPLVVDRASRRAMLGTTEIELTRVEFELLATMIDSPGRVFTREQLIDKIWGDRFALTDRTVDSHVKALRRKVAEAGGESQWIQTVRGVGYRVAEVNDSDDASNP